MSDMKVYGHNIVNNRALTNIDLVDYAQKLEIKIFVFVFMRDSLPPKPHHIECGIVNLNRSNELGSHWVCYFKHGRVRIYFDSFGQITPIEIQKYLKTKNEFHSNENVIQRNTDIVQHVNTHICRHLCLFILTLLTIEHLFFQFFFDKLVKGYS